jgi:hypothetical protein
MSSCTAAGVWSHTAWEKGRLTFMSREITRHGYHLTTIFRPDHVNVYLQGCLITAPTFPVQQLPRVLI